MLTVKQAQKLRGHIIKHVCAEIAQSWSGAQRSEDIDRIKAERDKARDALFSYIRSLTENHK